MRPPFQHLVSQPLGSERTASAPFYLAAWLVVLLVVPAAAQQAPVVLFDEADGTFLDASVGAASGGDVLDLAGPEEQRLPLDDTLAFSGTVSGRVAYRHVLGGSWQLTVGADAPVDLSAADSLVLHLDARVGIPGIELPVLRLVDADGRVTTTLPLALGLDPRVGFNAAQSGFTEGSTTDADVRIAYREALPADQTRPGYPEDLRVVFADTVRGTSTAGIGVPAVPARFSVEAASGPLPFRFRDTDGDGTLSTTDDYIDILTPEAEGSTRNFSTWRLTLAAVPSQPPAAGDVYLLAVDNGGVDGVAGAWQRTAIALSTFGPPGAFDLRRVQGFRLENGDAPTAARTLWVDRVLAIDDDPAGIVPQAPANVRATAGDASVVLRWDRATGAVGYEVYRQDAADAPFLRLSEAAVRLPEFIDLGAANGQGATYVVRGVSATGRVGDAAAPVAVTPRAELPDAYLEVLARRAFDFFWDEANPSNGLILDRSTNPSLSSIASVGFGLSAYTIGIDRGWITRAQGVERTLNTLEFFWASPQSDAPNATGYRGFYYHFLNMTTGRRAGTNELSTIDTALLIAGVLHAATYYDDASPDETRIRALADSLYERIEWDWAAPRPPRVALGWRPESGFLGFDWRGYNEAMILYILALGSPTHPLPPEAWDAWTDGYAGQWQTHYGYEFLTFPPLFGHQYSHVWIDFRGRQDAYMREKGIDYFENSRRATLANRAYAVDNPRGYPNYGPNEWGLTASDIPGGYRARGAPPAQNDDGTLTPTAPGGSFPFTPEESRAALREMYAEHGATLWGPYGLRDAYNVAADWTAEAYLGIDQGPILLMYENWRTGAIWERFMTHPAIQRGLERAGFELTGVAAEEPETTLAFALEAIYPHPMEDEAQVRFALPEAQRVTLTVYDLLGRRVATVIDRVRPAGTHTVALALTGRASGVYVVRLQAGEHTAVRSVVKL